MKIRKFLCIIAALVAGTVVSRAKVVPAPIFSDNMVLQQQSEVAIWGEATPGKKVKKGLWFSRSGRGYSRRGVIRF